MLPLQRRVAFLFDFEEVEHTSVLGLALSDIIKDAKHKLKPWELTRYTLLSVYLLKHVTHV
jgi:hypothetical protein